MRVMSWNTTLPAAQVQVPHLGVAHLALGQAHRLAKAPELGVGVAGEKGVHEGGGGQADRVAHLAFGDAPTVQDYQRHRGM